MAGVLFGLVLIVAAGLVGAVQARRHPDDFPPVAPRSDRW